MSAPGTNGAQTPQANSQTNQNREYEGHMNQAQTNQSMQPASPTDIRQAQQQLKSEGLYRGRVDGVMGPEMQSALGQFQRQQGLPETSQLDQQTLGRLNGGGSVGSTNTTGARPMTAQPTGATQTQSTTSPGYSTGTQNPATQTPSTSGNR